MLPKEIRRAIGSFLLPSPKGCCEMLTLVLCQLTSLIEDLDLINRTFSCIEFDIWKRHRKVGFLCKISGFDPVKIYIRIEPGQAVLG